MIVYINEIFRGLPFLSSVLSILFYIITKDVLIFFLFMGIILSGFITGLCKIYIFKYIENIINNNKLINIKKIAGIFERPEGAKNCGNFYINEYNYSYTPGMPSGHSILAGYISIYMYYYLIKKYKIEKNKQKYILIYCILFVFYTMHTRIIFGCHTLQQTIVGAAIGCLLGHYYYLLCNKIINT